jgi:hypothetical protein
MDKERTVSYASIGAPAAAAAATNRRRLQGGEDGRRHAYVVARGCSTHVSVCAPRTGECSVAAIRETINQPPLQSDACARLRSVCAFVACVSMHRQARRERSNRCGVAERYDRKESTVGTSPDRR